jgi:osmotically inducible protein OsmC
LFLGTGFSVIIFYTKQTNNMKRTSTATWLGSGKEGKGTLSSQSTVLNNVPYSYNSRFDEGVGTNPEELIAAAHAGCFTMKLSFVLGEAGYTPEQLTTDCTITMEAGKIKQSLLVLKARIPNIHQEVFEKCAQEAKENCPVSLLLNTEIVLQATLG